MPVGIDTSVLVAAEKKGGFDTLLVMDSDFDRLSARITLLKLT